jgi:PAS domain S-box-containing protein
VTEHTRSVYAPTRAATDVAGGRRAAANATGNDSGIYRALVEQVRDYAIFALDRDGYIVTWNAGARAVKGYTAEEIIGQHFSVFYPPEALAIHHPEHELLVAEREGRFEEEGWRIRKDGSSFWANVVITAMRGEAGELVGFVKVTRDLTDRKAAQDRAIADARRVAEAEAANRGKSEFLAAMSHELRTPLNAISGYVDLLQAGIGGAVTEKQKQFLDRIRRSQQHLLGIINELLNYSRVEAGQLTYDLALIPVRAVMDAAAHMVIPQAAERGIVLELCHCTADLEAWADRAKVEQILLNLLSNALKFTGRGGRITMSCARVADVVRLEVSDTGRGIPADQLKAIFEPFVQVGRSLTSDHEGTGLGLAISRDLARAMRGELAVVSDLGAGSTFTLTVPAARPPGP